MIIKDSTITINVKDLDRSITFYESLGITLKQRWDNHYAELAAPGLSIGLHPTSDEQIKANSGNVSIGFTSDDLEGAAALLKKFEIEVKTRIEEGGDFLHFKDPDGTALYFINPKW